MRILQEFRLNVADSSGALERAVAATRPSDDQASIPLLTSIDNPLDVATLRTAITAGSEEFIDRERIGRATLAPFVANWQPPKWYRSRVTELAGTLPHRYRMAVTESGINDVAGDILADPSPPSELAPLDRIALLWIGVPVESSAGLLVLVGDYHTGPFAQKDRAEWPLALSRKLGVRIYEGVATTIGDDGERAQDSVGAH